jgi:hypothetical protein
MYYYDDHRRRNGINCEIEVKLNMMDTNGDLIAILHLSVFVTELPMHSD